MLLKNWLSNGLDSIAGAAYKALRSVCFSFATLIYRLIISLYNMFDIMCRGRILDNSVIKSLAQRVGLVLGIVMLFLVAFSFIRMLLDPELVTDKSKGAVSIIKKTILVIVMLGISNYFFQLLYSIQSAVVENHVVSKLLLPYSVATDKFGGALSAELFVAFYDVDSNYLDSDGNISSTDPNVQLCQQEIWTMKERITTNGDFSLGNVCLNASAEYTAPDGNQREGFVIDFNWFLILVAGIFAAYTLVIYCIKLGIRMIQMAFLEIISPMAIISYLSPKQDNMFSKWSKIYFSTYIDIFLRIGIINFAVYLIAIVLGSGTDTTFWDSFGSGLSKGTHNFIEVVLVLSLLTFAKKAPDLLKDLFPAGASKLGFGGMKMSEVLGLSKGLNTAAAVGTGATVGFLGGAFSSGMAAYKKNGIGSAIRNGIGGAFGGGLSGAFHGIDNGLKAKNVLGAATSISREQRSRNFRAADAISQGSTFGGRVSSSMRRALGQQTRAENMKSNIDDLNTYSGYYSKLQEIADRASHVKKLKADLENARAGNASPQQIAAKELLYKNANEAVINDALRNNFSHSSFSGVTQDVLDDMAVVKDMANRIYDDNKELFNSSGIDRIDTSTRVSNLKAYSGAAQSASFRIENSVEYEKAKADDEFGFIPPDEQFRRKNK